MLLVEMAGVEQATAAFGIRVQMFVKKEKDVRKGY